MRAVKTYPLVGNDPNYSKWLTYGFIGSLLLHSLLFLFAQKELLQGAKRPKVIEVSIVPPPGLTAKRQIVSEPNSQITDRPPENARYEAEHNRAAPKEQIKRGDGEDAGRSVSKLSPPSPPQPKTESAPQREAKSSPPQSRPAEKAPERASTQESRPKGLTQLRLSPSELQGEFGVGARTKEQGPPARELLSQPTGLAGYQPFSRPVGSGARFLGTSGSSDYLPQLPDGDITLLNAKANKFAVFVRRVATRVFSKLRASGWESLSPADISRMKDFSTIYAVLSPEGKLLKVSVGAPSGSSRFDQVLRDAVETGATDPHPPPGAFAADGNVHFIFKAKSWSQIGPSRGGKGLAEQRWLLLATGLE